MTDRPADRPAHREEERRRSREQAQLWATELVTRFCAASDAGERAAVLAQSDLPHVLDENAALALYLAEPALTSGFIERHLPRGRRADDPHSPWQRLMDQAQARDDQALYFALYRAQAAPGQWVQDVSRLARSVADAGLLCTELRRRHPNRWRPDVGPQLAQLAQERGEHLLPYLLESAGDVWSLRRRAGYEQIAELARRRGWLELWAAVLGSCASSTEYEREVQKLVQDKEVPETELTALLASLGCAGAGRAPGDRIKSLRDSTLLALYERFPQLVRSAFAYQLNATPNRPRAAVVDLAITRRDDALIDLVAARLAVRTERSGAERLLQVAAKIARYVETSASSAGAVESRSLQILASVPPRSIRSERELVARNPLARLLFERAANGCLASEQAAAQLLRAPDDRVCAIAVRALSGGDPCATAIARQVREPLLAALERRLPRSVGQHALGALDRLVDGPGAAAHLVSWARRSAEARGPQDGLLALLARQLRAHPALQEPGEKPVIYRRAAK
ncbi:MAG TPA: hypothetical protein VEK05_07960 [Burkholderiales bacterium]|nr:hypothetical protein [Burkholderiales bacterium]